MARFNFDRIVHSPFDSELREDIAENEFSEQLKKAKEFIFDSDEYDEEYNEFLAVFDDDD